MTADTDHHSDQGTMDISEHVKTWNWFVGAIKWGLIANVVLLGLLAIFRTHNG